MAYILAMPSAYFRTLFGDAAHAMQARAGSRAAYARMEAMNDLQADPLTDRERSFLKARDSFYLASVSQDGWPYVQHKGGAPGFVKVLGADRIGFADYAGNKQYISNGNLVGEDRVALFFMDYRNQRRLKLIGHARTADLDEDRALTASIVDGADEPERIVLVDVVGFDWNCPKYITPRFTLPEIEAATMSLREENGALRAELARLKGEGL